MSPPARVTPEPQPRTEAGKTLLAMLRTMDALDDVAIANPVDWAHGIVLIEQQAADGSREALLDEIGRICVWLLEDSLGDRCKEPATEPRKSGGHWVPVCPRHVGRPA